MTEKYTEAQTAVIGAIQAELFRAVSSRPNSNPAAMILYNGSYQELDRVLDQMRRLQEAGLSAAAAMKIVSEMEHKAIDMITGQRLEARRGRPVAVENTFAPSGPGRQRSFGDGEPVQSLRHDGTEGFSDRPLRGKPLPILPNKPRE